MTALVAAGTPTCIGAAWSLSSTGNWAAQGTHPLETALFQFQFIMHFWCQTFASPPLIIEKESYRRG